MADSQLPPNFQGQLADMWRRVYQQARAITNQEMAKVLGNILSGGKIKASALPIATTSSLGVVEPDGSTITITTGGVISASAGGGSGLTRIAETILGADTAAITFSSISGSYRHLFLTLTCRSDQSSTPTIAVQLNADTGAHYDYASGYGNRGAFSAGIGAGAATSILLGITSVTSSTAGAASSTELLIFDYARTSWFKQLGIAHTENDPANGNTYHYSGCGSWESTAAVTAVKLFLSAGNFKANSVATLWGMS